MKVSRAWLQTYFDAPIPSAEKLAELFTFHSFEVEGIEGMILDLKILPDRGHYCLSHRGVAEEVSVLTKILLKNERPGNVPVSIDRKASVTIEARDFCRRCTARFVENIAMSAVAGAPFAQIKDSLESIGQRSINPVVDATNFTMFDIGQPTHAFDADKVSGNIVIRAAKSGEKITLLDGKEYTLTADDHVIADDAGPLDIAGVKGGKRAEVTGATKNALITSANFSPSAVRRTSTRLNLRNEASKRFENEITPELAGAGMDDLSVLMGKLFPQAHFGPVTDEYPVKATRTNIILDPAYVGERLGVSVPEATIKDILNRLGIGVSKSPEGKNRWLLDIPFHRLDLAIPEDIVEEVGRIYGYEHVAGKLPMIPSGIVTSGTGSGASTFDFSEKIRDILVNAGFSEVYLYTLVPKGDIQVAHPLASDKAALRTTLTAGITECLEANARNAELLGLDAVQVFEIGKVFRASEYGGYKESLVLALGAVQVKRVKGRDGKSIINEALKMVSENLGIDIPIKSFLSSGRNAVCEIEIDPLVRTSAAAVKKMPTAARSTLPAKKISYKSFSLYPFIVRDIAVFVSDSTIVAETIWIEMEKGIADAHAQPLLARHSLFDTFEKDGKMSFAFRLVFQSSDRTLTDAEANTIMDAIYLRMSGRGWQVR